MERPYSSYLVRTWRLGGGARRVEVEHIQSGRRLRAASLAAALAWIDAQGQAAPDPPGMTEAGVTTAPVTDQPVERLGE